MVLVSAVPPESTTSGSPLEIVNPLPVTPEETVMVIGQSFVGSALALGSRSIPVAGAGYPCPHKRRYSRCGPDSTDAAPTTRA